MWRLKQFSKARQAQQAYRRVFCSDDGQAVLADLAERHCVTRPTYADGMSTETMLINEGRRQVVLEIMGILRMNPEDLPEEYNNG